MSISWFVVAADLRGIRIGRLFLAEAEKLASADGATSLRVAQDCKLARYFERCGFVSERGTLSKTIR
jgi:GNAT superfamily N-acetyltransferase